MELIKNLGSLFVQCINTVVQGAPYLCYLLIAAFVCALLFNLVHVLMGGR